MPATALYRPAEAHKQAGISHSTLRNYTSNPLFRPFFSKDAAPERGANRLFSPDDVKVLRYIAGQKAQGRTHAQIAAQIAAGALASFDWQPPAEPATAEAEPIAEAQGAEPAQDQRAALMVLPQMLASLQANNQELNQAIIEATRALASAESRLQAQAEEIERLHAALAGQEELARLRAQLAEAQGQAPKKGFWARLRGK